MNLNCFFSSSQKFFSSVYPNGNIMGNIWNKYGKHAGKHNRSCGKPVSIKQISFMVFIDILYPEKIGFL